ncbi:MAG: 2-oxoacid:acceptor oxidoreductase family protein [Candidatus Omnitrophica bacterium]|jgi:2-oxoglutarate ferredoxin oxidoreductase subunit gamma|nr:2-oxoacid:acceptor oxidoreductase family protein [Candidatus Omnitrophota bacterium]
MTLKVIVAGSGGQGVMLLGKILALSGMREGKNVTWLPAYGAEVRGGAAHCMVAISDKSIGSAYIHKADVLIAMNQPSLDKFKNRVTAKAAVFINASQVENFHGHKRTWSYNFGQIAAEMGQPMVLNILMLGALLSSMPVVKLETALQVIHDVAPENKKHLVEINQKALIAGSKIFPQRKKV